MHTTKMKFLIILAILQICCASKLDKHNMLMYCSNDNCKYENNKKHEKLLVNIIPKINYLNNRIRINFEDPPMYCSDLMLISNAPANEEFRIIPHTNISYRCTPINNIRDNFYESDSQIISFGIKTNIGKSKKNNIKIKHINPLTYSSQESSPDFIIQCLSLWEATISINRQTESLQIQQDNKKPPTHVINENSLIMINSNNPQGKVIKKEITVCMSCKCDIDLSSHHPQTINGYVTVTNEYTENNADYFVTEQLDKNNNCIITLWFDGPPETVVSCNKTIKFIMGDVEIV